MHTYKNYEKPHPLDGKTPAEACEIIVEGENKWLALIQNESQTAKEKELFLIKTVFQ